MAAAACDSNKNPTCACCNAVEETFHYIFQCKSSHATITHKSALKKLKDFLRKAQTAPIIQRAIIQCIEKHHIVYEDLYFKGIMVSNDEKELATKVFRKKEQLGYTAFMQGYMLQDWSVLQKVYNGSSDTMDLQIDCMTRVMKAQQIHISLKKFKHKHEGDIRKYMIEY